MPGVRSAVDIALWDLAARRAGIPLHRLIEPDHPGPDRLSAYASLPTLEDPRAYADEVIRRRAEGYAAAKIHAWGDPDRDLEAVRAAREADGDMDLIYDAEGCLDRASAERMAGALGDMGVRWFEAPLPDLDIEGYRTLVRLGRVPIVPAGDAIWDPRLMHAILPDPPWSAMRFDVTFAGGITSAIRLFEVAAANGLDVELTSYGQTPVQAANLHTMLAFGRTSFFERAVPEREFEFGVTTPIAMDPDGTVGPLEGPGLGVELDEVAIDAAVLARFSVCR
jgi:L-alanine-DL-glutamate epimerase-like enolase superfamily enzyme